MILGYVFPSSWTNVYLELLNPKNEVKPTKNFEAGSEVDDSSFEVDSITLVAFFTGCFCFEEV